MPLDLRGIFCLQAPLCRRNRSNSTSNSVLLRNSNLTTDRGCPMVHFHGGNSTEGFLTPSVANLGYPSSCFKPVSSTIEGSDVGRREVDAHPAQGEHEASCP